MCYSAEVSFLTWGFGMACAAFLYATGQPIRSFVFPLAVTQMQLVEGLRWMNYIDERVLAVLGKLVLYAQPVAGMIETGRLQWILPYAIVQGILEVMAGSRNLSFAVAKDGHFRWEWIDEIGIAALPYWIALFLVTGLMYPAHINMISAGLLMYYGASHWQYETWGSLWCVSVNFLWIYYLLR